MHGKEVRDCKSILAEVHGEGGVRATLGLAAPGGLDYYDTCSITGGAVLGGCLGTWRSAGSLGFVEGVGD